MSINRLPEFTFVFIVCLVDFVWKHRFGGEHFPTPGTSDGTFNETMDALETKLTQLKLAADRTESINALRNETAIERHLSALKALTVEADQCKRVVEETKIAAKESPEDLDQWITEVDGKILYADESVKSLKETLEELRHEELLKESDPPSLHCAPHSVHPPYSGPPLLQDLYSQKEIFFHPIFNASHVSYFTSTF